MPRTNAGATAWEYRSPANVLSDIGAQPLDATLTSIAALGTAADKYLYSTAIDTWAEGAITTFGRSLLDDADAATGRNTLGASTGVWPATLGGTDQSAYTVGDLLYASTTTALSKLAAGTSGYVLTSGGAGVAPSWAAAAGGSIDGSGAANRVAYWSDADTLTSDADLVFNGTQLLTTGLFVGALTGTPARALEVRSTSAQIRASYDASNYAEITVNATGQLVIGGAGSRYTAIAMGGAAALAATDMQIAIGYLATTTSSEAIAIGRSTTAAQGSTSIGYQCSSSTFTQCVSVGYQSSCGANSSVAIGSGATAGTGGNQGIAIGLSAVSVGDSIALGRTATTTAGNQFVCGGTSGAISNVFFGKGVTHATPTAWTLNGTGGSGTDIAGGPLNIGGGKPTGAGAGGSVVVQTAPAGASGTTLRSLVDRLTVDQKGNIYPGTAALATGATDGFLYIQTCAGTPTGVPTTVTGRIAIVYDTTNKKLYAYNGAWESVTFA